MSTRSRTLFHTQVSALLNLQRLRAHQLVAEVAGDSRLPLASREGFVRQILGWREYVRGVYWTQMPGYLERNALEATADLPGAAQFLGPRNFLNTGATAAAVSFDSAGVYLETDF